MNDGSQVRLEKIVKVVGKKRKKERNLWMQKITCDQITANQDCNPR